MWREIAPVIEAGQIEDIFRAGEDRRIETTAFDLGPRPTQASGDLGIAEGIAMHVSR